VHYSKFGSATSELGHKRTHALQKIVSYSITSSAGDLWCRAALRSRNSQFWQSGSFVHIGLGRLKAKAKAAVVDQ
jgi:hypothetical protein